MAASPLTVQLPRLEFDVRLASEVRRDVQRLVDWLSERAAERGLTIERVRVSRWRSAEVPQNRETVVEAWMGGDRHLLTELWLEAGKFAGELPAAGNTRAPLTIDIHWA
jgi:hypothetical protein